jgi:hypothetical protein
MKDPTANGSEINSEDPSGVISIRLTEIIIPDELNKPIPVSLKFILTQWHESTCDPVIITPKKVLVAGIKQLKVGKLLRWTKIPTIIQNNSTPALEGLE